MDLFLATRRSRVDVLPQRLVHLVLDVYTEMIVGDLLVSVRHREDGAELLAENPPHFLGLEENQ